MAGIVDQWQSDPGFDPQSHIDRYGNVDGSHDTA